MKWFFGALFLLLAALLLESGLLAYSMYVLLALLLLSRLLARNWIGNLSVTRFVRRAGSETDDEGTGPEGLAVEIGSRIVVRLLLKNESFLPVPWVLAEDLLPNGVAARFPKLKVKGRRLKMAMLRPGGTLELRYALECLRRGYHQIGPVLLEGGDLFGLHRRYRVLTEPRFVLVYPRVVALSGYDLASRRPIGDVRMTHRLFEDPTRIAGVRPYESGDPLSRVHWRATARTGMLHSKIHEPSTLSGITVVLDFHRCGYPPRGEPFRSELAVLAAVALVNAVCLMGQQAGLVTNARDAAERIRTEGYDTDPRTRQSARASASTPAQVVEKLEPLIVPTRRGSEQLDQVREMLARAELTEGLTLAELVSEAAHRMPRDATVLAVLPDVAVESAIALGSLRRRGMAVAVVMVGMDETGLERAYARLTAEGIRDIRHLSNEDGVPDLAKNQVNRSSEYDFANLGE
jgi:uncharacterized protein (DUF58 family)